MWRHERRQSRPGRFEAGFPISGRRFWDAPSLIKLYYKRDDFGPPAVQELPGGFAAPAGRVNLTLDFRFRAGGFEMLRPYWILIV